MFPFLLFVFVSFSFPSATSSISMREHETIILPPLLLSSPHSFLFFRRLLRHVVTRRVKSTRERRTLQHGGERRQERALVLSCMILACIIVLDQMECVRKFRRLG